MQYWYIIGLPSWYGWCVYGVYLIFYFYDKNSTSYYCVWRSYKQWVIPFLLPSSYWYLSFS
jgi:hypothetical protein